MCQGQVVYSKYFPGPFADSSLALGKICGSVMLDERFEAFLSNKIGEEYRNLSEYTKRAALQRWQTDIKTAYAGPEDNEFLDAGYMVPLPGVSDLTESMHQGMLHMSK